MSIIAAVKTYIATYQELKPKAPITVDYLGAAGLLKGYAIIPLPGTKIIETYINNGTRREFPFAFQSVESTADELKRLENSDFMESLSDWFEEQTEAGTLPDLDPDNDNGKTAESIEVVGWGYLYQTDDTTRGVYQVNCKLTYEQDPIND
jgi:hypothetical protein